MAILYGMPTTAEIHYQTIPWHVHSVQEARFLYGAYSPAEWLWIDFNGKNGH